MRREGQIKQRLVYRIGPDSGAVGTSQPIGHGLRGHDETVGLGLQVIRAYGAAAIGEVCPGLPLSFLRTSRTSLTGRTETHLRTALRGVRRIGPVEDRHHGADQRLGRAALSGIGLRAQLVEPTIRTIGQRYCRQTLRQKDAGQVG